MDDDKRVRKLLTELIELMNQNDLAELEIEEEGSRIRLRKAEKPPERPAVPTVVPAPGPPREAAAATRPPSGTEGLLVIKSPMVGTFYKAPNPDADPFAEVNDTVTEESVICIIEAMKVMNEIKAECQGVIRDVLVGNGEPVEYGQPLFLVEPA